MYLFILRRKPTGTNIPNLKMYGFLNFIMTDTDAENLVVLIQQPTNHKAAVLSTNHTQGFS